MNDFIHTVRYDWHPIRIIYLLMAVAVFGQAWYAREWTFGMLGGLFLYQSLFNVGCCGANRANAKATSQNSLQDTDYTEIK